MVVDPLAEREAGLAEGMVLGATVAAAATAEETARNADAMADTAMSIATSAVTTVDAAIAELRSAIVACFDRQEALDERIAQLAGILEAALVAEEETAAEAEVAAAETAAETADAVTEVVAAEAEAPETDGTRGPDNQSGTGNAETREGPPQGQPEPRKREYGWRRGK